MKGLENAGHTCFFNAALQCLVYCPNMTNYFLAGDVSRDINPKLKGAPALANAYAAFVQDYWTTEGTVADPSAVYAAFTKTCKGFTPKRQHDAHEALVCVLEKLHDGLSRLKPGDVSVVGCLDDASKKAWKDALKNTASVVSEVFMGLVETRVHGEGYDNTTHDVFSCLSLPATGPSLASCIEKHMSCERLDDFKVDGKSIPVDLTRKFTYLPRILVVHLKRFDGWEKVDKFIDYQAELDLGDYCVDGCTHHYQLFAVCLHRGSIDDGHYTACAEVKGRWYMMDDASVVPLANINDIIQRDAYVLLYKRL